MANVKIIVRPNGPLRVEGEGYEIVDQEGRAFSTPGRPAVSLCRCGHSERKPFCDGTHNKIGFKSEIAAFELPAPVPKA